MKANAKELLRPSRRGVLKALGAAGVGGAMSTLLPVRDLLAGPSVTQGVIVKNAQTGAPISGATVVVTDNLACYSPKVSDSAGRVTFTTGGIRTIQVRHGSYAGYCVSPQQSSATYSVPLSPLPTSRVNKFIATTAAVSRDVTTALQRIGAVKYLGTVTLGQLDTALGGASVVGFASCQVFPWLAATPVPEACKLEVIVAGAAAGTWLAINVLGVSPNTKFRVYIFTFSVGLPTVLLLP